MAEASALPVPDSASKNAASASGRNGLRNVIVVNSWTADIAAQLSAAFDPPRR